MDPDMPYPPMDYDMCEPDDNYLYCFCDYDIENHSEVSEQSEYSGELHRRELEYVVEYNTEVFFNDCLSHYDVEYYPDGTKFEVDIYDPEYERLNYFERRADLNAEGNCLAYWSPNDSAGVVRIINQ